MDTSEAVAVEEAFDGYVDPSYGGIGFEHFTLKDGTSQYRVFPGIHELAGKDYVKFWYTHFWQGRDARDSSKLRSHPILCIQEKDWNKGGMVVKQCPLCQKRALYQTKIKEIEAKGAAKGATKQQIAKAVQPYNQWLKNHGVEGKARVYAMDKSERVGILRMPNTALKKLRAEIKRLRDSGNDPIGKKGVWFDFTRSGKGFDTDYDVEPHRIDRADGAQVLSYHQLTKPIWEAVTKLPSLTAEMERIRYKDSVLEQLAALEGDDPDEVNKILGIQATEQGGSDGDLDTDAPAASTAGSTDFGDEVGPAAPAKAAAAVPVEEDDEEAALEAKLAAKRAAKAAAAAAAAKPAAPAAAKPAAAKLKQPEIDLGAVTTDADFDALFPVD